ncbi:MAG: hypothetical protein ACLR5G_09380 [Eubacteriales bacterium]
MIDITLHPEKVAEVAAAARERIEKYNIRAFKGMDKPLFLISDAYPGIWLEHVYDSVISAKMDPSKLPLAVNTLNLFMDYQRPDGQLPCYVWDANKCPNARRKSSSATVRRRSACLSRGSAMRYTR